MEKNNQGGLLTHLKQQRIQELEQLLLEHKTTYAKLKNQDMRGMDEASKTRAQVRIDREQRLLQKVKDQLLQLGVKLERRGRPSLAPEDRADHDKKKLTVRLKKKNIAYLDSLKQEKLIDTYAQLLDSLIEWHRLQPR